MASEEEEDNDEDEVSVFRNLQLPVFSRWTSSKVWCEGRSNHLKRKDQSSKSSMYKTAVDIVALMSMRPDIASAEANRPLLEEDCTQETVSFLQLFEEYYKLSSG